MSLPPRIARLFALLVLAVSSTSAFAVDEIFRDGFAIFTLTIDNYLAWCTVSENGAAYSASADFHDGTVVQLRATPNVGFAWGYFFGADSPTSTDIGQDHYNSATMTSDRNVQACCPSTVGGTC